MCYSCNQSGHHAFECPPKKKQGGGNGNSRGKQNHYDDGKKSPLCSLCNKKGHMEANSWGKPGNESKKPQWLKKREQASAVIGYLTAPELLLCGLTFPTSQKILEDPNVWIGDTAVTTHSTPHTKGQRSPDRSWIGVVHSVSSISVASDGSASGRR
jgi:hypothetical protein